MEKIYKFRVLIDSEEEKDAFRDIEVESAVNFLQLHLAIQEAFNFDNSQMASFYKSDAMWERGQEISLMDMTIDEKSTCLLMENVKLTEFCKNSGDKFLYIFDFLLMWTFFVELVEITDKQENEVYPRISLSYGDAPDQYSKAPEDLFGAMTAESSAFDLGDLEGNDAPDNAGEGHENIDNLDI